MRAFFGLFIPDPLIVPLRQAQDTIVEGRAVPAENLHLTLAFLEDVDRRDLEEADAELAEADLPAPDMAVTGLVTFGTPPRLVAAEISESDRLLALHRAVHRALRNAGIVLRRERFRPHVTLRRFPRGMVFSKALAPFRAGPEPARLLGIWQSTLTPDGPRYDLLADYPLGGR